MPHQEEHEHECYHCGEPCSDKYEDSTFPEYLCKECHEQEDCGGPSDHEERMDERRQMGMSNF